VRAARSFGAAAPQNPIALDLLPAMAVGDRLDEDCLYLNVWTPAADGARRPVLFWIHGGAFVIGAGSQSVYDGAKLAARGDVVVVTINYRLGSLGFLNLQEVTGGRIPATGNEGLLDQVAALEWVQENIAAFGGDPDNVTIFGESAGGMSVGCLLGMPRAKGLFAKAIPQSGASSTAHSKQRAVKVAERLLGRLGIDPTDVASLRAQSADRLLAAVTEIGVQPGQPPDLELGGMITQPVIDGDVLPALPIETVARGNAQGVPLLVGSTLNEWKLFTPMDATLANLDQAGLLERLRGDLGRHAGPLLESYSKIRAARGDSTAPVELFAAIQTDRIFRIPGLRLVETQLRHEPRTYSYLFTWKSPLLGGLLESCHALELGFVFGTYDDPGASDFSGSGEKADSLARRIQDAWLGFARRGDPGWPAYTRERRSTGILGESSGVELAPFDDERRAWDDLPVGVL
jgi:para-nitrobenzyl esterase